MLPADPWSAAQIENALRDARARTELLIEDVGDAHLRVDGEPHVEHVLWELGNVAWYQERHLLRPRGERPPLIERADLLFDPSRGDALDRWRLDLPTRSETLGYLRGVLELALQRLRTVALDRTQRHLHQLVLFHEDELAESLLATRQRLGLAAPPAARDDAPIVAGACPGDVDSSGGVFELGARSLDRFAHDNEMSAHVVQVRPFRIARAAVTQGEFAQFVDEGGYARREFWSEPGWRWRERERPMHPRYWERDERGGFCRRRFGELVALEPARPVVHVNAFEAEAFCRFAGRRLPTEIEWEFAASALLSSKRRMPWGDEPATAALANLDRAFGDTVDVNALRAGDSAIGLRQMLGNAWEWTSSDLTAYPAFQPGPDRERSVRAFGVQRVLRGGSHATRARAIRNTYRRFASIDRRDLFAGFRTAAMH